MKTALRILLSLTSDALAYSIENGAAVQAKAPKGKRVANKDKSRDGRECVALVCKTDKGTVFHLTSTGTLVLSHQPQATQDILAKVKKSRFQLKFVEVKAVAPSDLADAILAAEADELDI